MGGGVTVRSELGGGSTFTLTVVLPRSTGAAAATLIRPPPAGHTWPRLRSAVDHLPRVLLVEDHPVNRQVVELILGEAVALECAGDGFEGLEAFKARSFDVVLMDMQMPVMDGLEATREIRALERAGARGRTPIVMLSANAFNDHVALALTAGADFHLAKPVTADTLLAALEQALDLAVAAESVAVGVRAPK